MATAVATSASVEVVYRGIFQKTLASRICRGIVLASRLEGKVGTAFARYGDSPERNGVPAKNFAVVATDQNELEKSLARYEPSIVDVSVCVDDTMCKGIESWAWYGIQPINKLVREGGFLIVTSDRSPEELLEHVHRKPYDWTLAIVPSPRREGVSRRRARPASPACGSTTTTTPITAASPPWLGSRRRRCRSNRSRSSSASRPRTRSA
jgi:hypothetical protein